MIESKALKKLHKFLQDKNYINKMPVSYELVSREKALYKKKTI